MNNREYTDRGPLALIAASREGAWLAARLGRAWPEADRFVLERFLAEGGPGAQPLQPPLSDAMPTLFRKYRGLVFFLPVGAVVRLVAPCLRGKRSDPAVVAVDDGGRFAVSVLSGHLGGANALAERAAAALGATPVVTSALERRGQIPPELIGVLFGWRLEATHQALLRAAAALVNGEAVGLYPGSLQRLLPAGTACRRFRSLSAVARANLSAAIIATDSVVPASIAERYVIWRPREVVIGVGCSSGAPADELEALVQSSLAEAGCAVSSAGLLASLDRKLAEPALLQVAQRLDLEQRGYTEAELAAVTVPNPSEVVRRAVGTASVAEAAALLASGAATLLLPKRASGHATVALARRSGNGPGR